MLRVRLVEEVLMDKDGFTIVNDYNVYAEGKAIRSYRVLKCLACGGILQVQIIHGDDSSEVINLNGHCKVCNVIDFTDD